MEEFTIVIRGDSSSVSDRLNAGPDLVGADSSSKDDNNEVLELSRIFLQ